ncbi:substrate-binding domain-containing protein [Butyricicoccus sp.]
MPDDVSLIGFDDSYMSSMANQLLTTIRVPKQTMAARLKAT